MPNCGSRKDLTQARAKVKANAETLETVVAVRQRLGVQDLKDVARHKRELELE